MLTDLVQQAGVVGAGGAGFPTHVKLNAKAEYFIINAAECEPLIETDKFICRQFAEKVVDGAVEIGKHLEAKHIVIALKGKYKKEIAALKKVIDEKGAKVEIFEMGSYYPAGDEQVMVEQVTGRSVPERGIPLAVGAVVDNVGTVMNVYDALRGIPVTEKYLSVVGEVERPVMMKVPLGTPFLECIQAAKPKNKDFDIVRGGPMMGKVFSSMEAISKLSITKTDGNIIVLPKGHYLVQMAEKPLDRVMRLAQSSCLQCRACTDQCPRYRLGHRIQPHMMMRAAFYEDKVTDPVQYERLYGDAMNCSECGLCEMYACPMGLSPRKVNVFLKSRLREQGIDVPKSPTATAREANLSGRAATDRLECRLGLRTYGLNHDAGDDCMVLNPEKVTILFSQHIGKPATCVVKQGDIVKKGDLVAAAAEGALSTNIHASVDGVVESVDERCVVIKRKG